jgi:cation diffusion facilitator CzcD-associated flavoprotein CzcO
VQSIVYSYSFAQNTDWTREMPLQKEVLAYLTRVAQEYRLYEHVRFASTVESAKWDDDLKKWCTSVKVAAGSKEAEASSEYTIHSDFFVSAVGQLSQPKYPDITGLESFPGKTMHSSRWDWSYDMTNKKVALIGTGTFSFLRVSPRAASDALRLLQVVARFRFFLRWQRLQRRSPFSRGSLIGLYLVETLRSRR